MYISSTNHIEENKFKLYKIRCNYCAYDIFYNINDIRYHRNFVNGFIYCPNCRRPLPHKEDNKVVGVNNYLDFYKPLSKEVENECEKKIKICSTLKIVFLILGILLLAGSVMFFGIGFTVHNWVTYMILSAIMLIFGAVFLIVRASSIDKMINKNRKMLEESKFIKDLVKASAGIDR